MGGLQIIFGTAGFNDNANFPDVESVENVLKVIADAGVTKLDTARLYGESEKLIGSAPTSSKFTIDTKAPGGFAAGSSLQPETLYKEAHESLSRLKVNQVDIYYIHAPDATVPSSTWLPTIDKLHKEGVFRRFGLSNFTIEQVRDVYSLAQEHGYVLPSGFLAKTRQAVESGAPDAGRFANNDKPSNKMYRAMYLKPSLLAALDTWGEAAEEQGVSKAELAYRWVSYHAPLSVERGDAIIFGARNAEQVVQTVEGLRKGGLKRSVVEKIERIWEGIKHEAPLDNHNSHTKDA